MDFTLKLLQMRTYQGKHSTNTNWGILKRECCLRNQKTGVQLDLKKLLEGTNN